MTQRDRLIELIKIAPVWVNDTFDHASELVANYLLDNCEKVFGLPLEELNELVTAKKENRIIKLPCKRGDLVYCIRFYKNKEPYIKALYVCSVTMYEVGKYTVFTTKEDVYGKTVFSTLQGAEKTLAEMRGKNE